MPQKGTKPGSLPLGNRLKMFPIRPIRPIRLALHFQVESRLPFA